MTATEQQLSETWAMLLVGNGEKLRIEKTSDSFSVGGHSLLLLKMQAEIRDRLSIDLTLPELFQNNTLEGLSSRIDASGTNHSVQTDWEAETALHSDILGATYPPKDTLKPKTVLLTGATGFLGRALCKKLSASPGIAKIECLAVRNPKTAQKEPNKIFFHAGDLTSPFLGLSEKKAKMIFESADPIIPSGADVSHMKSYQSLRRPNVESTKELVRLAGKHKIPFHFISTAGVALSGKESYPEVSVAAYPPPTNRIEGWASERFLDRTEP